MKAKRGYTIIECITYVAVLLMIISAAFASYYRCELSGAGLRRNAEDIVRAMHAGERWRADIRAAIEAPQLTPVGVIIRQSDGEIRYEIDDGILWRQTTHERTAILKQVKRSAMMRDLRGAVRAWHWELELRTEKKAGNLRPLFTFEAAEGQSL